MSTASEHGSSPIGQEADVELQDLIIGETLIYKSPGERAAYRAGMSTAAMICDAHAKLRARNVAPVARDCGDAIMRYRELVSVHTTSTAGR